MSTQKLKSNQKWDKYSESILNSWAKYLDTTAQLSISNSFTGVNYFGGPVSFSTSVSFKSTINVTGAATFSSAVTMNAAQTIALAGTGAALTLRSSDSTATAAPDFTLDRDSNSPAAADTIGRVIWNGRDDGGASQVYGVIDVLLRDVSAGSEDASMRVFTTVNGATTVTAQFSDGMIIGAPTGSFQGAGTLNLDNALFRDGTQLLSVRVTGWSDPFGAVSRAVISTTTATTNQVAQALAALITDLKSHGLIGT